ncbi:MAG: hypothetical protein AAGU21_16150 [Solidesulfovibrio sp.]|uniref:hypothetical protein n=1 Tax=Solidesulfovibrio sp. TaxID=2910990 RepID=UPI002B1ED713|nr:hypothetical protein [Solidesulfovibrio sp.]MEA4855689.1 hypothetical protein [Solidesulfovibrio sp.]
MDILIATPRPEALAGFRQGLADAGNTVQVVASGEEAAVRVAAAPPKLCVVDAGLPDTDAFALVARLMAINALVDTAVVSELAAAAFHEAGEGLGILMRLPSPPGPAQAGELLDALRVIA